MRGLLMCLLGGRGGEAEDDDARAGQGDRPAQAGEAEQREEAQVQHLNTGTF